jgi:ribonuclease HI
VRVNIWCDGSAMPNGGPAGAGYVIVGDGVHLLGSDALGDASNSTAEYTAVLNALRGAANKGATGAHVRMDSLVVFKQLRGLAKCKAKHLLTLRAGIEEQVALYPKGGVTFGWIPREQNGVADALAKAAAVASKRAKEAS